MIGCQLRIFGVLFGARSLLRFAMRVCTMVGLRRIPNYNVAFATDFEYLSQCLNLLWLLSVRISTSADWRGVQVTGLSLSFG